MKIELEFLKEFLEKYGLKWSGYACRLDDLHQACNTYTLKYAQSFEKDINCPYNSNLSVVFLYFGVGDGYNSIHIRRPDENLLVFKINEARFTIYDEKPNPEPSGWGDYDYDPYVWVLKKDLSKEWIKFLLQKVPNYKAHIYASIANNKQEILNSLTYRLKYKDEQIKRISNEKEQAKQSAKEEIIKLEKIKQLVAELDKGRDV